VQCARGRAARVRQHIQGGTPGAPCIMGGPENGRGGPCGSPALFGGRWRNQGCHHAHHKWISKRATTNTRIHRSQVSHSRVATNKTELGTTVRPYMAGAPGAPAGGASSRAGGGPVGGAWATNRTQRVSALNTSQYANIGGSGYGARRPLGAIRISPFTRQDNIRNVFAEYSAGYRATPAVVRKCMAGVGCAAPVPHIQMAPGRGGA
jgi:hypothetical protein